MLRGLPVVHHTDRRNHLVDNLTRRPNDPHERLWCVDEPRHRSRRLEPPRTREWVHRSRWWWQLGRTEPTGCGLRWTIESTLWLLTRIRTDERIHCQPEHWARRQDRFLAVAPDGVHNSEWPVCGIRQRFHWGFKFFVGLNYNWRIE